MYFSVVDSGCVYSVQHLDSLYVLKHRTCLPKAGFIFDTCASVAEVCCAMLLLQRPPEEDAPSTMCELLPTLERRDGLSSGSSLYHRDLLTLTPLCSKSSAELSGQSSPTDNTVGARTATGSKRTVSQSSSTSPSLGQTVKKARRRTADRPPLVQHNAGKKQKEASSVSTILQQHNGKTTVCVC